MHPRLTVIAGVPPQVRGVIADELIGALGATRSGVHLELTDDEGAQLVVFRPSQGAHRVVSVASGEDRSDDFRAADGRIDLLSWHGLDPRRARETMLFDSSSSVADSPDDEVLNRLASIDQGELWSAASRVRITDEELAQITEKVARADDAETVAQIERRHQVHERADQQEARVKRLSALVAFASLGMAVPAWFARPDTAFLLGVVGVLALALVLLYHLRAETAHRAERTALAQAGANSYLGYMVSQVDGLFDSTEQHKRLTAVAEDHRSAAVRWTQLAGDVSVEWAFEHHDEIEATAQLRRQLRTLGRVSPGGVEINDQVVELAHSLITHAARLRRAGHDGESLPLIIDDPLGALDERTRVELLELVERTSGPPQVIILTDDPVIASWARPRALSGDLDLVEPGRSESSRDELAV
ncbi:MAG: hypothetical protein KDB02_10115 [Acidimicrobiales bacterium]|nr:hypothetical protein [Acidimicrobiales bacterium]